MEGVVTPEIWIAVASRTGISELRRTTREEPNYQKLMNRRIAILDEYKIPLSLIRDVISELDVLEGSRAFLDGLRRNYQVVLLSDTFEQFADHFVTQLGYPHLLCHRLIVEAGQITRFDPRGEDAKRRAVLGYQELGYHITAVGDSHNDINMLQQAEAGSCVQGELHVSLYIQWLSSSSLPKIQNAESADAERSNWAYFQ